jgi:hypothetical protein
VVPATRSEAIAESKERALSMILVQTMIMQDPKDWDVDRFSPLAAEFAVWLIGVDQGNGLRLADARRAF